MVAKADLIINPDLERFYAQRMKAIKTVEIDGRGKSFCLRIKTSGSSTLDRGCRYGGD